VSVYRGEYLEELEWRVTKDGRVLSPRPSQKVFNHSPDGFSWGYGGSGPAQLALALLLEVIGNRERAVRLYQHFKWEVIAMLLKEESWEMTSEQILAWVGRKEAGGVFPQGR
jgi:hypothetical protein